MIQPNVLANRLGRIRRRVRRLVWIDGLSRIAALLIGAAFVVGAIDWLVHIDDPVIRLLLGLGIVAASAWAAWRYLVAPLSHPLTDSDVAFQIERRYPGFNDSLASTVQFLDEGTDPRLGSPEMQQLVIEETLDRLESVDLADVLNSRAVKRVALVSAAVCGAVLLTAAANPVLARIALKRLAAPFASNAWPLRTHLRLLDERFEPIELREGLPLRVVQNSEMVIFVEDVNGQPPDDVRLEFQIDGGQPASRPLRRASLRDPQGESRELFAARLPTEAGPVQFRAVGGDDSTMPYHTLEVVPPPVVEDLQVMLNPPAYSQLPAETLSPGVGHVQAIVGTRVSVRARLDRSVAEAVLHVGEQDPIPVTLDDDSRSYAAEFVVEKEGLSSYGFELRDDYGFRHDAARYEIRARADLAPQVSIDKPESDLTLTVDAQVPVKVTARDDLGLRDMRLRYQVGESTDASAGIALPFEGDRVGPVSSELVWNMAELRPKEGMRIVYHAEAGDDYNLGPPHIGKSPQRAITIVSREEKVNEVAAKQLALLNQLQTVRGAQDQAREQSGEIAAQWSKSAQLKSEDIDTLKRIDLEQRRIAARLSDEERGIAAEAKNLLDELEKNRVGNSEMNRRLGRIIDEIARLSADRLPQIEQKLTDALKEAENANSPKEPAAEGKEGEKSAERGAASLDIVRQGQAAVVEGLDALLRDLGQWRDQRELQAELEGMIARQKELNRDSSEVGRRTLTRALPELTPQEQADLARLAERQAQQAERLEKFAEGMREAAKNDPHSASAGESGKAVQEKLAQQGNAGRMREAAERLRSNRVGEATREQQQVLRNLEEIEQLLKTPANRDLEAQIADLRKAGVDLEMLRKKQQQIASEAEALKKKESAPKEEAERLRKEQQAVREKAEKMEPRLRRLEAHRAERSMSRAASRMQQAEQGLEQNHGDEAAENSSEAVEDLRQAERELAEKQREAEEQLARETLEKMADTLKEMVARQQSVIDETLRLDKERASRGNWSRAQLKSLSELAGTQKTLKEETDDLVGKVKDAAVFAATLRSASSEMERAAARIEKRNTDATTVAAEKRAKQRFVDLVAALEKPKPGNSEQDQQPSEGQQQQGSGPQADVIALLAQLKLLKTLQVELAERTAALDQSTPANGEAKEDREQEAARIAAEQQTLADLARDLANEIAEGSAGNPPEAEP